MAETRGSCLRVPWWMGVGASDRCLHPCWGEWAPLPRRLRSEEGSGTCPQRVPPCLCLPPSAEPPLSEPPDHAAEIADPRPSPRRRSWTSLLSFPSSSPGPEGPSCESFPGTSARLGPVMVPRGPPLSLAVCRPTPGDPCLPFELGSCGAGRLAGRGLPLLGLTEGSSLPARHGQGVSPGMLVAWAGTGSAGR